MFAGLDGQALMAQLDAIDIHCSQSSACTSRRPEPSYVLRALGRSDDLAQSAIRFSFGRPTTAADVDVAIDLYRNGIDRLRRLAPGRAA